MISDEILEGNRVGIAISDFSAVGLGVAADRLLALVEEPGTAGRCVETARRLFSLEKGVGAYRAIYRRLSHPPSKPLRSSLESHSREPA